MVHCLLLYHSAITSLTKCFLLRAMFHEEMFEIHVRGYQTVIIFLWNVPETAIRHSVQEFEIANMVVGWGKGKVKAEAEEKVWQVLNQHIVLDTGHDLSHVEAGSGS